MALEREQNTYRRELPRLLADGEAGHALIFEDSIVSVWDIARDALQEGRERFGLRPIAVVRIDPRDPERFQLLAAQQDQSQCPA